jgi:hypothetical protein
MRYVFADESVYESLYESLYESAYESAYDLVHFCPRKDKNDISRNRKAKMMFPVKLNCVQFKIDIRADSYRTGNRMCSKSFADSHAKLYV